MPKKKPVDKEIKTKQLKKTEEQKIAENLPTKKDPFWPEGVAPQHLSVEQRRTKEIIEEYGIDEEWHCKKCGSKSNRSQKDPTLCELCALPVSQNSSLARRINSDWMEQAQELGIALFERQPEETDVEWRIWCAYRGYYPLKLPTYSELATSVGCAVQTVVRTAQKWSFKVRLIEWARHTDSDIQEKRIKAIREMNAKQLTMAQKIQDKLQIAIDALEPETLKPNELVNLFKMSMELERRITEYTEDKVESTAVVSSTKQQEVTKQEDIGEVLQILQKAGMLEGKQLGVEQTTRVVVKDTERGNGQ